MPLTVHVEYGHIAVAFTGQGHDRRHASVRRLRTEQKQS
jgi:hypothetical protein